MLPKVLKKGLLCLAFAGAIGGLGGCSKQQGYDFDISPTQLNEHQREVRWSAQEAEIYQTRTENFKRALKKGLVTQKAYDEGIKEDDRQIAGRRQRYVGTVDVLFWDGFFRNEMKKQGWIPREKMPELPDASTNPPPIKPTGPKA